MEEGAKETVIIVHGTWAAPEPNQLSWYQIPEKPEDEPSFVSKLNAALGKRGSSARCWAHCKDNAEIFSWSGNNAWIDRTRAASELAGYINELQADGWRCHVVAHSHGGNLVAEALPHLKVAPDRPIGLNGTVTALGTPFVDALSPIMERMRRQRTLQIVLSQIPRSGSRRCVRAVVSGMLQPRVYLSLGSIRIPRRSHLHVLAEKQRHTHLLGQRGLNQPPERNQQKRDRYELEDRIGKKATPRPASQDEAGDDHKSAKAKQGGGISLRNVARRRPLRGRAVRGWLASHHRRQNKRLRKPGQEARQEPNKGKLPCILASVLWHP